METIFSLAAKQGYKSAYFMGASVYFRSKFKTYLNTMHVDEIYGLEQTMGLPPQEHKFQWGDTDGRIFEKALLWLKENKGSPSITIICTINTHPPFFSEHGVPPGVEDTPITRAFYSTDQSLKNFMEELEKSGLMDKNTLLIIGADHQITHGGDLARGQFYNQKHFRWLHYSAHPKSGQFHRTTELHKEAKRLYSQERRRVRQRPRSLPPLSPTGGVLNLTRLGGNPSNARSGEQVRIVRRAVPVDFAAGFF